MTIQVVWDDPEQTIIRLIFPPQWTWRQLSNSYERANALIEAAPGRVDLIFDAHETPLLPDGALTHLRDLLRQMHPRTGLIVVVEGPDPKINRLGRILVSFLQRFFWLHYSILYTDSLDDARAILSHYADLASVS